MRLARTTLGYANAGEANADAAPWQEIWRAQFRTIMPIVEPADCLARNTLTSPHREMGDDLS